MFYTRFYTLNSEGEKEVLFTRSCSHPNEPQINAWELFYRDNALHQGRVESVFRLGPQFGDQISYIFLTNIFKAVDGEFFV